MPEKIKKTPPAPSASGKLAPLKSGKGTITQEKKTTGPRTPQQVYVNALKRMALDIGRLRKKSALNPAQLVALQDAAAQVKEAAGEAQKAKPDVSHLAVILNKAQAQLRGLPQSESLEKRLGQLLEQAHKLF